MVTLSALTPMPPIPLTELFRQYTPGVPTMYGTAVISVQSVACANAAAGASSESAAAMVRSLSFMIPLFPFRWCGSIPARHTYLHVPPHGTARANTWVDSRSAHVFARAVPWGGRRGIRCLAKRRAVEYDGPSNATVGLLQRGDARHSV